MNTIAQLPIKSSKAREYITLPIRGLAEKLADAEDIGTRRALQDREVEERVCGLLESTRTYETRVRLYEAILRAGG